MLLIFFPIDFSPPAKKLKPHFQTLFLKMYLSKNLLILCSLSTYFLKYSLTLEFVVFDPRLRRSFKSYC